MKISNDVTAKDTSCYNVEDYYTRLQVDKNFNTSGKTIFFLETSCKGGLNSRQACSVETASRANPAWDIFVLLTGPLDAKYQRARTYLALSSLPNINFARINVTDFTRGTTLQHLYLYKNLSRSQYPVVHHSDALRMLVLRKFGGIYLDLDVYVMKSFDDLPKNFITKETDLTVANGVIGLSKHGLGKQFSNYILKMLKVKYNPNTWSSNGPILIQQALKAMCQTEDFRSYSAATCRGMSILDKKYFYPIPYVEWWRYYESGGGGPAATDARPAYAHHVWNALGASVQVEPDSLFATIARRYCPTVYNMYQDQFGQ